MVASEGILAEGDAIEFFGYWTEKNARGKMKFQLEKTWETKKRMHRWQRNIEQREAKKGFNK
jgi:hypothetical protein